jgi:hypothetical protein
VDDGNGTSINTDGNASGAGLMMRSAAMAGSLPNSNAPTSYNDRKIIEPFSSSHAAVILYYIVCLVCYGTAHLLPCKLCQCKAAMIKTSKSWTLLVCRGLPTPDMMLQACGNCMKLAGGDDTKVKQCTACVAQGGDAYGCGQCLSQTSGERERTACFACLARKPQNPYSCYAGR